MLVNCCLMVSLFFGGWTLAMCGVGLTTHVLRSMGLFGGIARRGHLRHEGDDLHAGLHLVPRRPFRASASISSWISAGSG